MLLLVWPLALVLGACTMVQADPADRTVIESLSSVGPATPRASATPPSDDGAWRLRLNRL